MIEYYKVCKSFESFGSFSNNISIDVVCQTKDWAEADDCYRKLIQEFYNFCKENIDNPDIEFCTDNPNDSRTNKEIPLAEVTSLYSNRKDCWWHEPVMEKVVIKFFNKSKNDDN